jgi:hypothetical protein
LALYRFARTADDIADEGDDSEAERLCGLEALAQGLQHQPEGHDQDAPLHAIAGRLRRCLAQSGLASNAAHDLLSAFRQDVLFRSMAGESDVRDYCMRSAAPVGRMVLGFAGVQGTPDHGRCMAASDHICIGLQLANFAQDMGEDLRRGRVYAPMTWWPAQWRAQSPVAAAGVARADPSRSEGAVCPDIPEAAIEELPRRMALWALESLHAGRHLPSMLIASGLPGRRRLALEIALTLEGGREICQRVLNDPAAVWASSPRIPAIQLPVLMLRAIHALMMRDDA